MTDEEKKAADEAARAAAAKKAEDEKSGKEPDDDPEDKPVTREQHKKVKDEAIQNRRENKDLRARLDRYEKALGLISGKEPDKAADELAAVRQDGDNRAKKMLLIAELASAAPDAHNAKVLFNTAPDLFGAVEVDLKTDTVDEEMLAGALKAARKRYPFLFKETPTAAPKAPAGAPAPKGPGALPSPRTGAPAPDGSGSPGADGTLRQQWQALNDAGRATEAAAFYKANRAGIMGELKAAGR